jgi:hypothetical protein
LEKEEIIKRICTGLNDYIIYPDSVKVTNDAAFLIGKNSNKKYLFFIGDKKACSQFKGDLLNSYVIEGSKYVMRVSLTYDNILKLRIFFPYINPIKCNKKSSFGTGDRLGMVTAAHIRAFEKKDIFPILAQQSVRELNRTKRDWQDVMASAMWGYFESGLHIPFGADADHIKEEKDLKEAADAGFTMFTIDPSDYISELSSLSRQDIEKKYYGLKNRVQLEKKYIGKSLKLDGSEYRIDQEILIPAAVKYGKALEKVEVLYSFLKSYMKRPFDFEVSIDEVEEPVTLPEHYFIASELNDAGVEFDNLALRYPGRWEKAIDYMGELEDFERQLKSHVQILYMFEGYKLSLHSGSDKYSTYKAFSGLNNGNYHIKTAGTSYLEALRTISETDYELFRNIFTLSLENFEKDRDSYHLTTDVSKLKDINEVDDNKLGNYLDKAESRQILHVAFGSILTNRVLKEKLYSKLFDNEVLHYKYVKNNIERHLNYLA